MDRTHSQATGLERYCLSIRCLLTTLPATSRGMGYPHGSLATSSIMVYYGESSGTAVSS